MPFGGLAKRKVRLHGYCQRTRDVTPGVLLVRKCVQISTTIYEGGLILWLGGNVAKIPAYVNVIKKRIHIGKPRGPMTLGEGGLSPKIQIDIWSHNFIGLSLPSSVWWLSCTFLAVFHSPS